VLPDYGDKRTVSIGLNAQLLAQLSKAIGSDQITITFAVDEHGASTLDPIRVKGSSSPCEHVAAIMPCRIKEQGK
jgi:hypothetical protein